MSIQRALVFRLHYCEAMSRERDGSGDREKGLTALAATMKDLFRTSFG